MMDIGLDRIEEINRAHDELQRLKDAGMTEESPLFEIKQKKLKRLMAAFV